MSPWAQLLGTERFELAMTPLKWIGPQMTRMFLKKIHFLILTWAMEETWKL